jgi:DNA-binding LacI/PurR family transcriptional regulator
MAMVAETAAVSRSTVSNVINAPHRVRPQTRQRVEAVIAETGFRPLKAAQMLRTQRSHLIAVVIPPPGGRQAELHNAFLHALTQRAQEAGYRILLFTAVGDKEEINAYDQLLSDYTLDAFVLVDTHSRDRRTAWLHRRRVPFVTFGRPWASRAVHSWVDVDGAYGERLATEHLIQAGHRRIAFMGWPAGNDVGDDRCSGWEQAHQAAGLPVLGPRIQIHDEDTESRPACARLLDTPEPPTAFVCVCDDVALGVWTEITSRGYTPGTLPPGNGMAVIGFDDSSIAAAIGLASVAQPLDEVADACVTALDKLLTPGKRAARDHVLLAPRLVLRGSA